MSLKKAIQVRHFYWEKFCSEISRAKLLSYMGCILLITAGLIVGLLIKENHTGHLNQVWLWLLGTVVAIYGSQIATELVNLQATLMVKPQRLPRMDFTKGIPSDCRTLVVIPTMLGSLAQVKSLVEALEVRYLGNRDDHLHFMLLTDFNDAKTETTAEDEVLLAQASKQISALNARYPRENSDIFFLCHRAREWNACENIWMGWERKRGKLTDLNNLLRDNNQSHFSLIIGRSDIFSSIKYVITLDADTLLPRESAQQLVAAMNHPENRPRFDASVQRVVEGYAILQPRVAEALPISGPTRYARLCGAEFGIDPYTRSVSNVYQDVFHEGSFVGKGIYDVDLFQKVLGHSLPDNRILSHDLLEGCYLRSGFLGDVPLYEKSPSSYLSDAKRRARWIRGDWQLLGWLLPWVSLGDGKRVMNPLTVLSRLKLLDNLRRSVVPIALFILLELSWTVLRETCFWFFIILAMISLPVVTKTVLELIRKPNDTLLSQHFFAIFQSVRRIIGQIILYLACLPHEVWYSLDAILRTGWRTMISKKNLLKWTPSDQVDYRLRNTPEAWIYSMWMGPVIALLTAAFLIIAGRFEPLFYATPLLLLWFFSPLIARNLSQPVYRPPHKLNTAQTLFLNDIARKTWGFFETFVTAEDNWLPPDNYQETPVAVLARRTSPTNIGLSLLANLTAYDFGYIDVHQLLERTTNTFHTMDRLERYCGHFYNWYSTKTLEPLLPRYVSTVDSGNLAGHLLILRQGLLALSDDPLLRPTIEVLAEKALSFSQMDMRFLYDEADHLMTIGYNVDKKERDLSSYDLLSSEARLCCFVAIAQGQLRQASWFALGRLLISNGGEPTLVSWSGSMFEYLMPLLVMPTYPGTLLDQTYHGAVNRQIVYGRQRGVPWGISESGYNAIDTQFNYLYRAFGVPGLGLKRGLEEDLVIAPYATVMALMVKPIAACANLQRLEKEEQAVGQYGFYEAIDFTPSRLPPESKKILIRSFMAHHQGMSFLALSYLLNNRPMQKRFIADPLFQATLLLLQERIPRPTASYLKIPKSLITVPVVNRPETLMRAFNTPNTRMPQIQLLSNGCYHVMLTQAGGGYSHWKNIAITRWREDSTCDNWGLFSYVRDVATGTFWSTQYQPTANVIENFKAVFSEAHAEFIRTDHLLDLHTEIVVSPEDDIEVRRLRIHNRAKIRRTIEFTSYGEIVLATQTSDLAQPAFSNLFVETELLPEKQAILATRRSQDEHQNTPWLCHLLNIYHDEQPVQFSFETDRVRFVGRSRTLANPIALISKGDLSNTSGAVLDPIISIRCRLTLEPDALATLDLLTGVADTRENCIALIEKYHDRHLANRIFGLAWTHGQVLLHQLNSSEADAQLYGKLASAIIYSSSARRANSNALAGNRRGQSGLWGYSISGDLPILLLRIEDVANIKLVVQLIQAQAYWRHKGLFVDLVILNDEHFSYRQNLTDQIMNLIAGNSKENEGAIVVRLSEQVPQEDRTLLESVARVIISDKRGTLKEQLGRRHVPPPLMPTLSVSKSSRAVVNNKLPELPGDLQFFNGLGGFNKSGDEYIIRLMEGAATPAPWANILANPNFGTLVSESGQGYSWVENAHEFRLTPWENDPIQDSSGEAFYLRDEESGTVWSPSPLPCRGRGDYQTRHGFGYSVFEHIENGIYSELWIYVALNAPVKFAVLKIRNDSNRRRQLSATGYVTWVLGDLRSKNAMHVVTQLSQSGGLLAQNYYNSAFGERTGFFEAATNHLGLIERSITGDRTEFLGRNGALSLPAALKRKRLSGRVGAELDPCAAIQVIFELSEGQTREIVFTLGVGKDKNDAENIIQSYRDKTAAQAQLALIQQQWKKILSTVVITTPDASVNLLANGWLLYQTLSSRLWGRTGYYQSGGAFGFRDQLQDVMALSHVAPDLFRAQLLLCAAHQFEEGDVQHWWHPPSSHGVRTRCSDDYLWLPFALCHYIETTGDKAILDEKIALLSGRPLKPDEESYYELPSVSSESISLYQHAVRAINNGLKLGTHGLPLMGSGDWNDGMNLVGSKGFGESVWLAFFLYSVLKRFAVIAAHYGDNAFSTLCETESKKLQQNCEAHAWDGEWYLRAYFDDGTPLGSKNNKECRIDSIAQSWSVLSGAAGSARAMDAMNSLRRYLVSESDQLIKLLAPPFNQSTPNPGYIQGYLPGIRENGGQYTHAAVWVAMAFAQLGEKQTAWELFHMLNPIHHSVTAEAMERYKIEPYVTAGDIYSVVPHVGRGGWSWYTGSAGWLYRLITETFLGITLKNGNQLHLKPMLPDEWNGFAIDYRFGKTVYKITVNRVENKDRILLDEVLLSESIVPLLDDGQIHQVTLSVGI